MIVKIVKIDRKWNFIIPGDIAEREGITWGDEIFFEKGKKDGCLNICFTERIIGAKKARVQKNYCVSVPQSLRDSVSFFYGQSVALADKGTHIAVWPWPWPEQARDSI